MFAKAITAHFVSIFSALHTLMCTKLSKISITDFCHYFVENRACLTVYSTFHVFKFRILYLLVTFDCNFGGQLSLHYSFKIAYSSFQDCGNHDNIVALISEILKISFLRVWITLGYPITCLYLLLANLNSALHLSSFSILL